MSTFAGAIEELIRTYRGTLLLANAPAVDHTRVRVSRGSGGHGKHGTTTLAPTHGADVPLSVEMEDALARFALVYSRRLDVEQKGAEGHVPHGDSRSAARRDETRAILAQVGSDPTEVAYLYGRTTEAIRKLRLRNGLDADTGERVRRQVLTAPGQSAMAAYANRNAPSTGRTADATPEPSRSPS